MQTLQYQRFNEYRDINSQYRDIGKNNQTRHPQTSQNKPKNTKNRTTDGRLRPKGQKSGKAQNRTIGPYVSFEVLSGGFIAGYSESTPPGCFGQSSWPGWRSFGCCLIVFCWWLRSRVSWSVLALWHSCESHCRLSRLWLSPGLMWSHSVPMRLHPLAWCWAWHLLCALAWTWRRMAAHWVGGGRRCLRLLVFHLLRGCMWLSPALVVCLVFRARFERASCNLWDCRSAC